jgi:hypothetical protein
MEPARFYSEIGEETGKKEEKKKITSLNGLGKQDSKAVRMN